MTDLPTSDLPTSDLSTSDFRLARPTATVDIPVAGGAIPSVVIGPIDGDPTAPGLLVIPSIFGPAPDLVRRLASLDGEPLVVLPDPFWRNGGGVVPYRDHQAAISRLRGFDAGLCADDLSAALEWTRAHSSGRVVALGICFGGPFVLRLAGLGRIAGGVTWHGSRMEGYLDRAATTTCPLRLHFGEADPITPPAAIAKIREAFAAHGDLSIVVHPGAVHGFSHDGAAYDEKACRAGLEATEELLRAER